MFNRIRVVTMLMMVLGVFALLQLVSGGLLFSSLQHNQQGFVISNELLPATKRTHVDMGLNAANAH